MGVEFLIHDKLSDELVVWDFKVNDEGFVDVYIEGKLTDTLTELGKVKSIDDLLHKTTWQLTAWKVGWHSHANTTQMNGR